MALKLLETREQKENKAGNTGTKAVFREQGTTKSKNAFRQQGNTRKILLGTREHGPPWEALSYGTQTLLACRVHDVGD